MGRLQGFDTETKDLKQKREIERLQAEEKIKEKDEEISKIMGMLQNLEIENKDLKNMVEKNKIQTEETTKEKEEEKEMTNKIESYQKDLQNFEIENKDLKQKRKIERLQAEEKIRKKDEEISKIMWMLQNLEIENKDLKNRTEEKEKEKEMTNKIESDRKDFQINILAPPIQVTDLHGKIIQGTAAILYQIYQQSYLL